MISIIIVAVFILVITNVIYGKKTSLRPSSQTTNLPNNYERHSSFRLERIYGSGQSPTYAPNTNHTKPGDYCSNDGYESTGCIVEIVLISVFIPCLFLCCLCCNRCK